ncbi:hypothetical protein HYFRA_00010581 [Hymenoscyphus fraxineus]|uniref:Uncharacterized protein n=1 Tax=Hymenoscyphus fraxineus TaxID=746836 RepID=A0A9N9L8T9_9HELO|nr:hypothetical protein HYFRA_00010581 [Hymenoscyphus fraxineus]
MPFSEDDVHVETYEFTTELVAKPWKGLLKYTVVPSTRRLAQFAYNRPVSERYTSSSNRYISSSDNFYIYQDNTPTTVTSSNPQHTRIHNGQPSTYGLSPLHFMNENHLQNHLAQFVFHQQPQQQSIYSQTPLPSKALPISKGL